MPVGFVSLVGKMRTGKSYLMNKILNLNNNNGVNYLIFSSKLILQQIAVLKGFGCGLNPTKIIFIITSYSSLVYVK